MEVALLLLEAEVPEAAEVPLLQEGMATLAMEALEAQAQLHL